LDSTVVFLNEIFKLVCCFLLFWNEKRMNPVSEFMKEILKEGNLPFIVPCFIYAIQNRIILVAIGLLDTALYQVLANLKIITTALFSVVMLNKSLHRIQWMALCLLAAGAIVAESAASSSKKDGDAKSSLAGVLLMIVFACMSGFAGVFTEKILKRDTGLSFFMKQTILYFWGSILSGIGMCISDWSTITEKGFFVGYTGHTWAVIFCLAFGGLLVAMVITYLDNITKVYVTCVSMFATAFLSYLFFDFQYSTNFLTAMVVVTISIFLYNDPAAKIEVPVTNNQ